MCSVLRSLTCLAGLLFLATPRPSFAVCDTTGLEEGSEVVELTLSNGTLCLEMLRADAPVNVDNFLYYVTNGEYDGSLFHRHLPGFVLQGGDQRRDGNGGWETIPKKDDEDVLNEPCTRDVPGPVNPGIMVCSERGNERGTIAAAKLPPGAPGGGPNSASTNFFINLADNRENLDNQNGGFTVYARVMGDGMDYVDTLVQTTEYQRQAVSSELGSLAAVSLMGPQGVGEYEGCFDPDGNVGAALDLAFLQQFQLLVRKPDPRSNDLDFFLGTSCGATPVPNDEVLSFVPNECSGAITSLDELTAGWDPVGESYLSPQVFFRHTCNAVDQFLDAIEAAKLDASYQAAYEAQVVYIDSATLIVVPEPVGVCMQLAAAATLLVGARCRAGRRPG